MKAASLCRLIVQLFQVSPWEEANQDVSVEKPSQSNQLKKEETVEEWAEADQWEHVLVEGEEVEEVKDQRSDTTQPPSPTIIPVVGDRIPVKKKRLPPPVAGNVPWLTYYAFWCMRNLL